jgi:hypothetical protein
MCIVFGSTTLKISREKNLFMLRRIRKKRNSLIRMSLQKEKKIESREEPKTNLKK